MPEGLLGFLNVLKAIAICLALGALVSLIYFNLRRKDLFGGFIGGLVVGTIGAIIGVYLLDFLFYNVVTKILEFLSMGIGVNVIAGFIGAYAALYIMNRLNHDRERKKY
jgi:uncharacterized membrane protein YeaQ/YmgE (transglycosylase-associated protein family)